MAEFDHLQAGRDGQVTVDFRGEVAILTFDCGENRFNNLFVDRVDAALDQVLRADGVRILLTTGSGKFYSNGLDLKWMEKMQQYPEEYDKLTRKRAKLCARMLTLPIPTVAVITGHYFALGAIFSLCHDYRIMQTQRGWWCLNEVFIGIHFNATSLAVVRSKLTGQLFHEALTMGRRYTAETALEAGIVQRIFPPANSMDFAIKFAREILPEKGYNRDFLSANKENALEAVVTLLHGEGENEKSKL